MERNTSFPRRSVSVLVAWLFVTVFGVDAPGLAQDCGSLLVPVDADYKYFKGRSEPSPGDANEPTLDWTEPDFDDATWEEGVGGVGYGDRTGEMGIALDDMRNSYWSVYLRTRFELEDPDSINVLELSAAYDDGFVAYLNGVEILRRGVGAAGDTSPFNTAAASHESTNIETFTINDVSMLTDENVLAIQVHNTTLGSSDCVWIADLVANPDTCPQAVTCQKNPEGTVTLNWVNRIPIYDSIQILRKIDDGDFEEIEGDIGGDQQTYTDVEPGSGLITYQVIATDSNGPCPECTPIECTVDVAECNPLVVPGDEWVFLRGIAPGPTEDWNLPEFDDAEWEAGATGIGYADGDDATILDDMRNNYSAIYTRKIVDIDDIDAIQRIVLSVAVDDGCVVYMNGDEIGRYNMPVGQITNTTLATAAAPEPVVNTPQEFTIDKEFLVEGENLLAISVHNTTLGSSDLTFVPSACAVPGSGGNGSEVKFLRGDADNDGNIVLTDAVFILAHLVQGGAPPTCPDAADTDDDGKLVLTDGIRLLNALFQGQVPLPAPGFLECGVDPTDDDLTCERSGTGCG